MMLILFLFAIALTYSFCRFRRRKVYSDLAEDYFYVHSETNEKTWDIPSDVLYYLPPGLEDKV